MFEILTVIVLFLLLFSVFIMLPILVVIKVARSLFEPAINEVVGGVNKVREPNWRNADAAEREKIVRKACGWRVIGRVVGAGALVTGAFITASHTLAIMWCVAAWRVVKPIREEMRDACAYRSTGAPDEPRYSSGDGAF